jgi:lipopolysaccharide transport system permease protein
MMIWYGISLTGLAFFVPLLLVLALLTSLAVGLWLAALNVRYRDVGHAIPFLIQIWMFASPVVYPVSMIPEKYRLFYGLNPMVGVIEGFRWALLGNASPDFGVMTVSAIVMLVALAGGLVFFKRLERTFADVV